MKKEKQVRSYQRRTKSGKMVTVKAHTAKYDAAEEMAKEIMKKKGAGKELEERKKKAIQLELPFDKEEKKVLDEVKEKAKLENKPTSKDDKPKKSKTKDTKKRTVGTGTNGPEPKNPKTNATASEPAFTAAEFKEWYRGTGSAADKKVAKALRAQLGRAGYRKLEDEAIDNYTSRGHLSMFKRVSGGSSAGAKDRVSTYAPKATKEDPISEQSLNSKGFKAFKMPQIGTLYLRKKGKKGNGAYIKFKGKRNIQKADIDDYADFITGHNGLTKAQKKQLSSLGYAEYEEY